MASGFIGNEVPRKGLRVRVPCPPLLWLATSDKAPKSNSTLGLRRFFFSIPKN